MKLDLGKLGSTELKALYMAVKNERERRGKKNPNNHASPLWAVPNKALTQEQQATAAE